MKRKAKKKLIDFEHPPRIGTILEAFKLVDGKRVPAFLRLHAIQIRQKMDGAIGYQLVWRRDDGMVLTSGLHTPLRPKYEWHDTDIAWLRAILREAVNRGVTTEELEVMARSKSSAKAMLFGTRTIIVEND